MIGITGLLIVYLIVKKTGLWVWTSIIVWNAVAIWDASAFIINTTNPWLKFFVIQTVGASKFFAAPAMHPGVILLVNQPDLKAR